MSLRVRATMLVFATGAVLSALALIVFGAPEGATPVRAVALGFGVLVVLLTLLLGLLYHGRYLAAEDENLIPPVIVWGMAAAFLSVFGQTVRDSIARWDEAALQSPTIALLLADVFSLLWLVAILIRQLERSPDG
jgi:hypothetical protein